MTGKIRWGESEKMLTFCKKNKWLILTGAVGLLLLLFSGTSGGEAPTVIAESAEEVFSAEALETRLEAILTEIDGAGDVRVLLTLESGTETVYATDTTERNRDGISEREESLVLQTQNGGTAAVERKLVYPKFAGAVVVCDGADQASVKWMVLSAVSAATGLSSDKISVLPRR